MVLWGKRWIIFGARMVLKRVCCSHPCVPLRMFPSTCSLQHVSFHVFPSTFTLPCVPFHMLPSTCSLPRVPFHMFPSTCSLWHVPIHVFPSTCSLPLFPFPVFPSTWSLPCAMQFEIIAGNYVEKRNLTWRTLVPKFNGGLKSLYSWKFCTNSLSSIDKYKKC